MKMLFSVVLLLTTTALAQVFQDSGISVEYPENWEIAPEKGKPDTASLPPAGKTLVNLQRKTADDKYHSRFSIVVDTLPKQEAKKNPVRQYEAKAIEFLKNQRFSILRSGETSLPHVKGRAFEITAHQRDFGLTFYQVVITEADKAYLITAAARTAQFENQKSELRKLVESFRLTQG